MGQSERFNMGDSASIQMTPPIKKVGNKEYGAVLSANEDSMMKIAKMALELKKSTGKPIMIILGGD